MTNEEWPRFVEYFKQLIGGPPFVSWLRENPAAEEKWRIAFAPVPLEELCDAVGKLSEQPNPPKLYVQQFAAVKRIAVYAAAQFSVSKSNTKPKRYATDERMGAAMSTARRYGHLPWTVPNILAQLGEYSDEQEQQIREAARGDRAVLGMREDAPPW